MTPLHEPVMVAEVVESGRTVLSGSGQELLGNDEVRRAYLGL